MTVTERMELDAGVRRCGATVRSMKFEETALVAFTRNDWEAVFLQCDIASKGGGRTVVEFVLTAQHWEKLLPMIARKFRKELAVTFAESTATALEVTSAR